MKSGTRKARPAGDPRAATSAWRGHAILLGICVVLVVALHAPLLALPYYWDEAGYYIPAARDLYLTGDPIPSSTASNPHPPLLAAYLAGVWKVFGYSPIATRVAMAVVAGAAIYAVLLLGSVTVPAAAALWAAALTLLTPVFFAQSTLAHLDVAATLGTLLCLYFYLRGEILACVVAGVGLVLARETGAVVLLALAALEFRDGRRRNAAWLLVPLLPLAVWFGFLRWRTGMWLGDQAFAEYNVWGVLHPVRWLLQLLKRLHQLAIMNFHWVAALVILFAARRRSFGIPPAAQRVLFVVAAAYLALLSVVGGAPLTRYLLPVFPLFFLFAADAVVRLPRALRTIIVLLLPALLVGNWFWKPPYPYSYEDNLAYADFVTLHAAATPLLHDFPAETRVLTAWPASDELSRPWLGFTSHPVRVVPVDDFSERALEAVQPGEFDVLFLYSRQWRPEWFTEHAWLTSFQRRYFDYRPQASQSWIREHFGLELKMRTEMRGQWVEIWVKSRMSPSESRPIPQKVRHLAD